METKKVDESPMMKEWREIKSKHPDAVLLLRCGDFYEAYEEDAKECAKILGITLTTNSKNGYQMAGFPHHALDTYLPKLVRAGKRVAICDIFETPKQSENDKNNNSKNEETMAKKLQAADLIGKTIVVEGGNVKYVIKSVDGDKLMTDFIMGDRPAMPCPIPMTQVESMIKAGKWSIQGETADAEEPTTTAAEDVQDVDDVQPTAQTVKMQAEPKRKKRASKSKTEKPKATEPTTKLVYSTYKNKKGKTCAKVVGFSETDAAYVNAADLHGSASYERNKKGEKSFYLVFGPRYAAAAKEVCDALNAGKPIADCRAIIDKATEERAKLREEWKAKREEHKAQAEAKKEQKGNTSKLYTEAEVADLIKRVVAGDAEAMRIVNEMAA